MWIHFRTQYRPPVATRPETLIRTELGLHTPTAQGHRDRRRCDARHGRHDGGVHHTGRGHSYGKVDSVTAKEANKLFEQAFKQRCLTVHEARHIAHGDGELADDYDEEDAGTEYLDFPGTKKSHISYISVTFEDDCATSVYAYYRR